MYSSTYTARYLHDPISFARISKRVSYRSVRNCSLDPRSLIGEEKTTFDFSHSVSLSLPLSVSVFPTAAFVIEFGPRTYTRTDDPYGIHYASRWRIVISARRQIAIY